MVLVAVVMIVVFLIVLLLLVWLWYRPPSIQELTPQPGNVGLFYSCKGRECQEGLVCDSGTVTCKRELGAPCTNYADCPTGAFCSGLCVTGPYGRIQQPCPCIDSSLVCVSQPNGLHVCKGGTGVLCAGNQDCASGRCEQGRCLGGLPLASPCSAGTACVSGYCDSFGFCQNQGVTSGQVGAACQTGAPPPGTAGATAAGCSVSNVCVTGVCQEVRAGLGSSCTSDSDCPPPLSCARGATGYGTCLYPSNPNSCSNNTCDIGGSCLSGLCVGTKGQSCSGGLQCQSLTCSNAGALYRLTFLPYSGAPTNLSTVTGAKQLQWVPVSPAPPSGVVTLFSTTQGGETIYALATGGLYRYNGLSWSLLLATSPSPGKELFYANSSPDGSLFLVAYRESSGNLRNNTLYRYSGGVLTPYNPQANNGNIPGTQLSTAGGALVFDSLSISSPDNVLLLSGSTVWVKPTGQTRYTAQALPNGLRLASLYGLSPNNIAYAAPFSQSLVPPARLRCSPLFSGADLGYPLQFSGDAAGAFYPREGGNVTSYSLLLPPGSTDLSSSRLLLISNQQLYIVEGGVQFSLQGRPPSTAIALVTGSAYYFYSPSYCT